MQSESKSIKPQIENRKKREFLRNENRKTGCKQNRKEHPPKPEQGKPESKQIYIKI